MQKHKKITVCSSGKKYRIETPEYFIPYWQRGGSWDFFFIGLAVLPVILFTTI